MKPTLVIAISSLVFAAGVAGAQEYSAIKGNLEFFKTMRTKMHNHAENLNAFSRTSSELDRSVARELYWNAASLADSLDSVADLYSLYTVMETKNDKAEARKSLDSSIKHLLSVSNLEIRIVNGEISDARSPAIGSEGEHLRDDIRVLQERLHRLRY
ncbi:MAG TPA: hypothetical protein VMI74_09770 [Burkholderiales bacterium]|nr:hypothetical protein [Burkholderiales bacterium]